MRTKMLLIALAITVLFAANAACAEITGNAQLTYKALTVKSPAILKNLFGIETETGIYRWTATKKIAKMYSVTRRYSNNLLVSESGYETNNNLKGKFESSLTYTNTYKYDASGTLISKECINKYSYANGTGYTEKAVSIYTYNSNGDSSVTTSIYDGSNKLSGKTADITIADGNGGTHYSVVYDVDQGGNITYTHVYDNANTELTGLGGAGALETSAIIDGIKNPGSETELHVSVDGNMYFNSDKLWDFENTTLDVSGDIIIDAGQKEGYDIYVDGDMIADGTGALDFTDRRVYISGNLTVNAEGGLILSATSSVVVGGDIIINSGEFPDGILPPGTGTIVFNSGTVGLDNTSSIQSTTVSQGEIELMDRMALNIPRQLPEGVSLIGTMAAKNESPAMPKPVK